MSYLSTSAAGCRASGISAFGCVIVVIGAYCCCSVAFAQMPDSANADEPTTSWTARTDGKADNLNPARIIESHSQNGNQTVDKRTVEIRGVNGYLEDYQDIEREMLQVDSSTVRTISRTFVHDLNGRKTLVQATEEEK